MMYRRENPVGSFTQRRRRTRIRMALLSCGVLCVAGVIFALVSIHRHKTDVESLEMSDDALVEGMVEDNDANKVYRRRIVRSRIPELNYMNINYRELFNDSNYVQLTAARANGIDPAKVADPDDCEWLVPIFSTRWYRVDTMYHSVPYLVPEAVLLLDFIGHRFNQLMEMHYPKIGEHRIILTSALRTEQSERRLRRVNRNATDTSCHIYGTTFDLSAQRYEHIESGSDTVVDACKQMLALALYEIRYEGLCYVKYERGSCFHITLRTTQYEGQEDSEMRSYINPGSPGYLLTKAPPRPKAPATVKKANENKSVGRRQKRNRQKAGQPAANNKTAKGAVKEATSATTVRNDVITERERLSLEEYERRY